MSTFLQRLFPRCLASALLMALCCSGVSPGLAQPTLPAPVQQSLDLIGGSEPPVPPEDADPQAASCKFNRNGGVNVDETLIVDGLVRKAIVHLPSQFHIRKNLPLIIVLHGARLSAKIAQSVTGFDKIANSENFVVAYPDAVYHQWNDGRLPGETPAYGVNDVQFISRLIDYLAWKYPVDARRVFVTGYSSGGMLSNKLGMELTDKIAAIAPVASSIPLPQLALREKPSRPLPVLMINGTQDQAFPWLGGDTQIIGVKVGKVAPVEEVLKYWLKANGGASRLPDFHQSFNKAVDGTSVDVFTYTTASKASVMLYRINGGGHTWPGSEVHLRYIPLLGRQSKELSASELIWEFFKRCPPLPASAEKSPHAAYAF